MLYYKDDLEAAQHRYRAWWAGEIADRVALAVYAPRDLPAGPTDAPADPPTLRQRWTDGDYRIQASERGFNRTAYLGEALPVHCTHIGAGSLALFLGSRPTFAGHTVWFNRAWHDLSTAPVLAWDPDNEWWRLTQQLVVEGLRCGRGRYLTSLPDLVENLDILASLRGPEGLLLDLIDHPGSVHALQRLLVDLYFRAYDDLYERMAAATPGGGSTCYLCSMWGPGRVSKLQCDFAAMISPAMFRAFALPYLEAQCARLDHTLYHLDGPECLCHLDALLALPRLHAIQYTTGIRDEPAGSPQYYDLYRRIKRARKGVIVGVQPHEVEPLVRAVGPERVFVMTSAPSESAGRRLLDQARRW
jgi:hypothetical protein